jgi:ribosome-binding protein aMBF1 (putative translation factor)
LRYWHKVCHDGFSGAEQHRNNRKETDGMYRLNPSALDEARSIHGFTSDEKLAAAIDMTGTAIRNLRHGRTSPKVETLMKLRKLTGIPLEALIVEQSESKSAA